jgi:hypothetical protein
LEAFFAALATNGLAINMDNVFLLFQLWNSLGTTFWWWDLPRQQIPPTQSKHQAIAMFPWHGEFLLPFLAK